MKKLMFAAAALAAGVVMAEDITSANIVGYNTITVAPGSTTGLAVQFKDVTDGVIKIKNLAKGSNPIGGASLAGGVDQIWTFNGTAWTKYFYYSSRGVNKWLKTPVVKAATDAETEDTIANGQSFFYVRSNGSKATATDTVTLAGEVVTLGSSPAITVAPGSTTAMAYPWPQAFKIKNFNEFNANAIGGASLAGGVDQIWTFNGTSWTKYFYYSSRGVNKWLKTPVVKAATDAETEDEIAVGQAFFFVRSNGSKATATDQIVFKQLTAE